MRVIELNNVIHKINNKSSYIVEYKIKDGFIYVFNNYGNCYKIINNKDNVKDLNKLIKENKEEIKKQINIYDSKKIYNFLSLIISLIILSSLAACCYFSIFRGSIEMFLISIITFSIMVISSTIKGFTLYLYARKIDNYRSLFDYEDLNNCFNN